MYYSNRTDLLHELDEAVQRLRRAGHRAQTSVRSVRSPDRKDKVGALTDRLSEEDRSDIVSRYNAGELRQDIANHYGISISSVARVLRAWREER